MNLFCPSKSPPPLIQPRKITLPSGEPFHHCILKHFANRGRYPHHVDNMFFYEIGHFGPPSRFSDERGRTVLAGFVGDIYWDLDTHPVQLWVRHKDSKWVPWSGFQPPTHPIFLDRCLWGTMDPFDSQGRFGFGWFRLDTLHKGGLSLFDFSHKFSSLVKAITAASLNRNSQKQKWESWSFAEETEDGKQPAEVSGPNLRPAENPAGPSSKSPVDNECCPCVDGLLKQVDYYKRMWAEARLGKWKDFEIRLRNERIARIQDQKMHEEILTNQRILYGEEIANHRDTFQKIIDDLDRKVTKAERSRNEIADFFAGSSTSQ